METMTIASVITMLLAAFMVGYVIGVEHGADEERRAHDKDK
jgi:hypothetical protein